MPDIRPGALNAMRFNKTGKEGNTGNRANDARRNGNLTDGESSKNAQRKRKEKKTKREVEQAVRKTRKGTEMEWLGKNGRKTSAEAEKNYVSRQQHQTQLKKLAVTPEQTIVTL